jgi:hypothetical protein
MGGEAGAREQIRGTGRRRIAFAFIKELNT